MRANKTHLWAGKGPVTLPDSPGKPEQKVGRGPMVEPLQWPAWGPGLSRLLRPSQPPRHRTPRGETLKCCPDPNGHMSHSQVSSHSLGPWAQDVSRLWGSQAWDKSAPIVPGSWRSSVYSCRRNLFSMTSSVALPPWAKSVKWAQ